MAYGRLLAIFAKNAKSDTQSIILRALKRAKDDRSVYDC